MFSFVALQGPHEAGRRENGRESSPDDHNPWWNGSDYARIVRARALDIPDNVPLGTHPDENWNLWSLVFDSC